MNKKREPLDTLSKDAVDAVTALANVVLLGQDPARFAEVARLVKIAGDLAVARARTVGEFGAGPGQFGHQQDYGINGAVGPAMYNVAPVMPGRLPMPGNPRGPDPVARLEDLATGPVMQLAREMIPAQIANQEAGELARLVSVAENMGLVSRLGPEALNTIDTRIRAILKNMETRNAAHAAAPVTIAETTPSKPVDVPDLSRRHPTRKRAKRIAVSADSPGRPVDRRGDDPARVRADEQ